MKMYIEWRNWFAWRPVFIGNAFDINCEGYWTWFKFVQRKRCFGFEGKSVISNWTYREIDCRGDCGCTLNQQSKDHSPQKPFE